MVRFFTQQTKKGKVYMRKVFIVAISCMLLFSQVASASVGYRNNRVFSGAAADIDFRNTYSSKTGSVVAVYSNGYADGTTGDGVTHQVSGKVTEITSAQLAFGLILLEDIGALDGIDARWISLADGTQGQVITILLLYDTGGTLYISDDYVSSDVTPMTKTGWDDLAFADVNDSVTLLYFNDVVGWIITANNGVVIT